MPRHCVTGQLLSTSQQHGNLITQQCQGTGGVPSSWLLDKGIIKPFKDYYYELQNNWIILHAEGQKPTRLDVATWVNTAWNSITAQSITNTWESINFLPYIDR
jgi:hypothetical protein